MRGLRAAGESLLRQARAVRAGFPDAAAMWGIEVCDIPTGPLGDEAAGRLRAALMYLRDETVLVRGGGAGCLTVLDDEIAHAERVLRATAAR
jgi:hypothetical protein